MVGFVALDEILGFFFGGMVGIAFEVYIGNDFLHDSTANATCFRIPFDVIAAFERPGHLERSYRTGDASRQAMVKRKALSIILSTS